MTTYKYILTLLLTTSLCNAQTFSWAKSSTSISSDNGTSVSADLSGNVYITGYFLSSSISFSTTTLNNLGYNNIYLTKYNSTGNVLWAKSAGGTGDDQSYSVAADASGNVYIAGYFTSSVTAFGSYTLSNSGNQDIFLAKYDSNGNALWAKKAGGTGYDYGNSICVDGTGNVFLTGSFNSTTISFGAITFTNTGASNIFLTKYDSNGNVLWAKNAVGSSGGIGHGVSCDPTGNIFLTGGYGGPNITFGTYTLTGANNPNVFLTKYDTNGNVIWAKRAGGTGVNGEEAYSVSSSADGNVYITGYFTSPTLTFGVTTLTNTLAGSTNVFLSKYDVNGNVLWAKHLSGANNQGYSVSADATGVFITGQFQSPTMTVGTLTLNSPASCFGSNCPMFVAKYDPNGNAICATALAGGGDDENCISADQSGNAYLTAEFGISTLIAGTNTLTLTGSEDVFVAKYVCSGGVGVSEINKIFITKIFPNPNNGSFVLQIDNEIENAEIILINSLGQKVHGQKIFNGQNNVITNGLATGLYNYIVLRDKEQISNGKLTIE